MTQCVLITASQELLRQVERLKLVHGLDLLLALLPRVLEGFVLVFYALDLPFDLLFPSVAKVDLTLLVLGLVFTDFVQLSLLFDLQQ